jgi:hypothetical protein
MLQNSSCTVNGCSAQTYAFEGFSCIHSILLSSLAMFILQPKVPCLTDSEELISIKPVQGLNLNRQSISGPEGEGLITQCVGTHIKTNQPSNYMVTCL